MIICSTFITIFLSAAVLQYQLYIAIFMSAYCHPNTGSILLYSCQLLSYKYQLYITIFLSAAVLQYQLYIAIFLSVAVIQISALYYYIPVSCCHTNTSSIILYSCQLLSYKYQLYITIFLSSQYQLYITIFLSVAVIPISALYSCHS